MSSMAQDVVLGVRGLKGTLVGFEALLRMDPLPVGAQQPWVVLKGLRKFAAAWLPHLGALSTPHVKGPVLVEDRCPVMRR